MKKFLDYSFKIFGILAFIAFTIFVICIVTKLIKEENEVEYLNYNDALTEMAEGDLDAAERIMTTMLKLTPNNPLFHRSLGHIYVSSGNYSEAKVCYETAFKIFPSTTNKEYLEAINIKLLQNHIKQPTKP